MTPAFALPRFDLKQHWQRRVHKDSRNRWLRTQVANIFNESTGWRQLDLPVVVVGRDALSGAVLPHVIFLPFASLRFLLSQRSAV